MRKVLEIMVLSSFLFLPASELATSCADSPYERQGSGGTINAVNGDAVRAGIRYVGELTGRMDGYRGRSNLRGYCS